MPIINGQNNTTVTKTERMGFGSDSTKKSLENFSFRNCLEIGCGTGKNTVWLEQRVEKNALQWIFLPTCLKAAMKIQNHMFILLRLTFLKDWQFAGNEKFDLVVFSLVLEHIENLDRVFEN